MMIGMGLFWLAIILGLVWFVREGIGQRQPEEQQEDALAVLDRRFAEGAVSVDEYKQRRDVLTGAAALQAHQPNRPRPRHDQSLKA